MRLYHVTSRQSVYTILKEGIKRSKPIPFAGMPIERRNAVFAYDESTAISVAIYGKEDDVWIVFNVDTKDVYVGDLQLEGSNKYVDTFVPYIKYFKGKYKEAEFIVPKDIPASDIVSVLERRTFKIITSRE